MMRGTGVVRAAGVALVLLSIVSSRGWAEVQLSGTADHAVLKANNGTLPEVVSGLESRFNVKIRLAGTTQQQITGVYSGSLRRVLSRLLDGVDHFISSGPEGMGIVVVGPNGARPA